MLHIYHMKLDKRTFDDEERQLLLSVSKHRREKIERLKFDIDKLQSLYGSILLYSALKKHFMIPGQEARLSGHGMEVAYTEHRKPYLTDRDDIQFNLSHSGPHILLGISDSGSVGVDIEGGRKPPLRLMKSKFHENEIAYVTAARDTEEQDRRFYEIWTRKEAYLKMTGEGLTVDLKSLDTLSLPVSFLSFTYPDYSAAVCMNERDVHVSCIEAARNLSGGDAGELCFSDKKAE